MASYSLRRHFVLLLTLLALPFVSCKGREIQSRSDILAEQTKVFTEMAATLNRLAQGGEIDAGIEELDTMIYTHRNLKRQLAALTAEADNNSDLVGNEEFAQAHAAFWKALAAYQSSEHVSPRVEATLKSLHDPEPLENEGKPKP